MSRPIRGGRGQPDRLLVPRSTLSALKGCAFGLWDVGWKQPHTFKECMWLTGQVDIRRQYAG